IDTQIESKRNTLGVDKQHDLHALINDKYLQARAKALTVKERLCAKVQGKKFEFEWVDRAYSNTANESRLHSHIKTQITRHQPNILNLLKKYNKLCVKLQGLIRDGKATVGACAPRKLESKEVYSLDVDAPIWDDRGLKDGAAGPIPLWLGNEDVQNGIQSWLVTQRCNKEMKRLRIKCNNTRVWVSREDLMIHHVLDSATGNVSFTPHWPCIDHSFQTLTLHIN
ncbi:hypothetical protein FA13DRAFT_1919452, partial [Coprinellus micaceus]